MGRGGTGGRAGDGAGSGRTPDEIVRLREATDLILRPGGHLQFGVVPDHSLVLPVPRDVPVGQVLQVLREARRPVDRSFLVLVLTHCGIPAVHARGIVAELEQTGVLRRSPAPHPVYVTGPEPYSRPVLQALRRRGVAVTRISPSSNGFAELDASSLVLFAGQLFPPADLSFRLMEQQVPHMTWGMVDGQVAVGPLVVPGRTPCLSCLDATHLAADSQWRMVRAQATAGGAPADTPTVEIAAGITAGAVRAALRDLQDFQDATPDAGFTSDLCGRRRYLDPVTLEATVTGFTRRPGCAACALVEATISTAQPPTAPVPPRPS
jgi:bacteriocin biosynthesis cyclodehydratase domain-containing protein